MFKDDFIYYLTFEKRYSRHTQVAYLHEVEILQAYFKTRAADFDLPDLTFHQARAYFASKMEAGAHPRSVNRSISALRTFYGYLQRRGLTTVNPISGIKSLKAPKVLPAVVDQSKMDILLDSEETFSSDFEGLRDKLILELLFGTGIRLSELLSLKEGDFDFYSNQISVVGKRNKQRLVPLTDPLILLVKEYLAVKPSDSGGEQHQALIVTSEGAPAYPTLIYRRVQKYLRTVSSLKKVSPHVLRHSFATALLDNGADLNAIKELLGHANLSATQIYTHNSVERLKTIYKQAHPRA